VGYKGSLSHVEPPNLVSAIQHAEIVDEKIQKELQSQRIAGPFSSIPLPNFRISPIGLVEKKVPGKLRLIHHLSHPLGESINDGISTEEAHVQ